MANKIQTSTNRLPVFNTDITRMWANAQCDGHPVEYRWRPLFNTAKFGWSPLLDCRAVMPPRQQICCWLWCPKLTKRSQPLVGQSQPYCKHMWGRYCSLTSFFPIVDACLSCEDTDQQNCVIVRKWWIFSDFLRPVFSVSRIQHDSNLHAKFTLRPHHVWNYGKQPMCDGWN